MESYWRGFEGMIVKNFRRYFNHFNVDVSQQFSSIDLDHWWPTIFWWWNYRSESFIVMFETGDSLAKTRTNFLRAVSGCYALAFIRYVPNQTSYYFWKSFYLDVSTNWPTLAKFISSIYLQMDGLFGERGVLPLANRAAKQNPENFLVDPSLIWVGKFVGLSRAETAEVLGLVGGIAGKV